jgi:hypothetical protein
MRRPSHGTVVAYVSLFVALGGTSVAAATIAKNAVVSSSIKDGQVKTADLGANAVTSAKVKAGSLLASDLKAGELPAAIAGPQGPAGTAGATGSAGPPGAKGDPGAPGTPGVDGTDGTDGTDGVNGAATRVRASKTAGDVTVPANTITFGTAVTIPLAQNTWTQGATETDLFLVRVTVTAPATCSGGAQGLLVNARLGGAVLLGSHGGTIPPRPGRRHVEDRHARGQQRLFRRRTGLHGDCRRSQRGGVDLAAQLSRSGSPETATRASAAAAASPAATARTPSTATRRTATSPPAATTALDGGAQADALNGDGGTDRCGNGETLVNWES